MFNRFTVKTRLFIMLTVNIIAFISFAILGWVILTDARNSIDEVYLGGVTKLKQLDDIRYLYTIDFVHPLNKIRDDKLTWLEGADSVKKARNSINIIWKEIETSNPYLSDKQLEQNQVLTRKMENIFEELNGAFTDVLNILQRQNKEELTTFISKELFIIEEPLVKILTQMEELRVTNTTDEYELALQDADYLKKLNMIFLIITIGSAVLIMLMIIVSITKPLQQAVQALNQAKEGDTAIKIQINSGGDLGLLLSSIQELVISADKMSAILATITTGNLTIDASPRSDHDVLGNALHDMISQMRFMIGKIKNEVDQLASSSQQMMTSMSHLSVGASETASAVTETTTTVEEFRQTANSSLEQAKNVLLNTKETLQTVELSEKSVNTSIEDINQIHDRMRIISEGILKLSEKGLAISEIIDSVNDLAEQSNLLAVNAAIEAARAGEIGKSFGVVAQEIRILSEQSKAATNQVRTLLGEIQNATSAVVLATEQGVKAVNKGVEQSYAAGKAMKELIEKMDLVNQATNQIMFSNEQQLTGSEQISIAMMQITETTNSHLLELKQIEYGITTLNQVGISLKDLTDKYTLPGEKR